MNSKKFKVVTPKMLSKMTNVYYGGGNKLKIGDSIIAGFNLNYASFSGVPPSKFRLDDVSLSLQIFVLNKNNGMIYQLYKKID